MKCLTVRSPWPWAMFELPEEFTKDIENRSRRCNYRGPLAIHVSRFHRWNEIGTDLTIVSMRAPGIVMPSQQMLEASLGCIVGIVDVVDCVQDSLSRWAIPGKWHLVLRNRRKVRPVPILGRESMFECPVELEVTA